MRSYGQDSMESRVYFLNVSLQNQEHLEAEKLAVERLEFWGCCTTQCTLVSIKLPQPLLLPIEKQLVTPDISLYMPARPPPSTDAYCRP